MLRNLYLIALTLITFCNFSAYAFEPYVLYDNFNEFTINDDKWREGETVRQIRFGKLFLSRQTIGYTGSDSGQIADVLPLSFLESAAITDIKATVTVHAFYVTECHSNPAITMTRARIIGEFFNTNTPTAGSAVNDVIAQVVLEQRSDSINPQDGFNVKAWLTHCKSYDCNIATAITLPGAKDLGKVTVGTPITLWMRWDPVNNRFLFKRDDQGWVTIRYNVANAAPPGRPSKSLNIINNVDNCNSGYISSAFIAATFDNVFVNSSAVLP